MIYINPIYGVINQNVIQAELQRHHYDQLEKTFDCVKKFDDFLRSIDKVEPAYQQMALEQCCAVFDKFVSEHNNQ